MAISVLNSASQTPRRITTEPMRSPPPNYPQKIPSPPYAPGWPPTPPGAPPPLRPPYRPRAPFAAPPSEVDKWLRSHPLVVPVGTHHAFCCGEYRLRNITSGDWIHSDEDRGKPGFISTAVGAVAYFATAAEQVTEHVIRGEVTVSHLKSYEHMGSMAVRLLLFPQAKDVECTFSEVENPCPRRAELTLPLEQPPPPFKSELLAGVPARTHRHMLLVSC